jgi:hypothetical protein
MGVTGKILAKVAAVPLYQTYLFSDEGLVLAVGLGSRRPLLKVLEDGPDVA